MKKNFNHNPFVVGETVAFNGSRFKNPYVIKITSGEHTEGTPNGGGWHLPNGSIVEDDEVTHIRPVGSHEPIFHCMPGGWRVARDIDYFGKNYPIWCGTEYGFLYPDEIPAGKIVVPVCMFAYRKKRTTEITLFVAQGKIVDFNESTEYASLANVTPYLDHPAFWMDPNTEVMSSDEIISSMSHIKRFKNALLADEKNSKELITIFEDANIDPVSYVPDFPLNLECYKKDKERLKIHPHYITEHFVTSNVYLKDNAKTNEMSSFYNTRRSPEVNKVDGPNWVMFSKLLINLSGNLDGSKSPD